LSEHLKSGRGEIRDQDNTKESAYVTYETSRSDDVCPFLPLNRRQSSLLFLTSISLEQPVLSTDPKPERFSRNTDDEISQSKEVSLASKETTSSDRLHSRVPNSTSEADSALAKFEEHQNKAFKDGDSGAGPTPPAELRRRQNSFHFLSNISLGQETRPAKGMYSPCMHDLLCGILKRNALIHAQTHQSSNGLASHPVS